jgi:hypothetical protein
MRVSLKAIVGAGLALGAMGVSAVPVESYGSQASPIATFDYTSNANGSLVNQGVASYNNLASIGSLTLTVTIRDGDTAVGNFDFNDLTIGLDGFNTGVPLNGFANGAIQTLDISSFPTPGTVQNSAAILAALKADGKLKFTVFDNDVDLAGSSPGAVSGDVIAFPGGGTISDAVLQLREGNVASDVGNLVQVAAPESGAEFAQVQDVTAVPLPLAAYIAPLGAGLAGIYSRRFRRQK